MFSTYPSDLFVSDRYCFASERNSYRFAEEAFDRMLKEEQRKVRQFRRIGKKLMRENKDVVLADIFLPR